MAEEWTGGEYVADLEGGGPAYVWTDSAGNKLATRDPNPPSTPAGLPAGTPISTPSAASSVEPVEPVAESQEIFSVILPDGTTASASAGATTININGIDYPITYSSAGTPNIVGAPPGTTFSHLVPVGQPTAEGQEYVQKYQIADLDPEARAVLEERGVEGYNQYVEQARQGYEDEVKTFIESSGGNYDIYSKLPDDTHKQSYLNMLKAQSAHQFNMELFRTARSNIAIDVVNQKIQPDAEGNYPLYNLTTQDLQDDRFTSALTLTFGSEVVDSVREYATAKDTLASLPDVPVYDESGNLTGYDYTKISKEQATPAIVSAIAIMTPDFDTATLGATYVDVDELNEGIRQAVDLQNTVSGGSPLDVGLFLVSQGQPTDLSIHNTTLATFSDLLPNTTYVIARKALPLSEYILKEASFQISDIQPIPFQRLYYPTITATEYSRALEGKGYNINWLSARGAVIKPTVSETVRMLAGVDPNMTRELAGIDKAKLFGYGFVNTLAVEAAIALPFVASPLATVGLGTVSMAPTAMNWSRMSVGERRTALIVDGLFSVLIFGGPALRAASYIPRELRSWFGNIGSATLLNKVTVLNTALKTTEGVSQVTQTQRIVRAATDLKNLLVAAKDNGVQGLDRLIDQVELIRKNPQVFRGIGDMNLTPELENVLRSAETALKQIETGTYKPVLMATEGRGIQVASREAVLDDPVRISQMDDLFTDINRQLRISRQGFADEYGAEIAGGTGYRRVGSFVGEYGGEVEPMAYIKPAFAQEYGGEIGYTGYRYKPIVDAVDASARTATTELIRTGITTERATQVADVAIDMTKSAIDADLALIANILADAGTLSPNAVTFLLLNSKLGTMALAVAPGKVLEIVSKASSDLRTQFIDSTGLQDTKALSNAVNDLNLSESNIGQVQALAEAETIEQVTISQSDLAEIAGISIPSMVSETIASPTIITMTLADGTTATVTTPTIVPMFPSEGGREQPMIEPGLQMAPRERMQTATIPITREEAEFYELSDEDIWEIFKEVGNDRDAFLAKAKALWLARKQKQIDTAQNKEIADKLLADIQEKMEIEAGIREARREFYEFPLVPAGETKTQESILEGMQMPAGITVAPDMEVDTLLSKVAAETEAIEETIQEIETFLKRKPATITETRTRTSTLTRLNTKLATQVATLTALQTQLQLETQTQTQTQTQLQLALQTQTQTQLALQTALQTQTALATELATEVATETELKTRPVVLRGLPDMPKLERPPEPTKPRKKIKPPFLLLNATGKELTSDELEGAVAWRQGIMYKLIYPPYGKVNIINSRKPFPNMKIHTGADSAFKTLVQRGKGTLPKTIKRDMGIMDITIVTGVGRSKKPKMKFKLDRYQSTDVTPRITNM